MDNKNDFGQTILVIIAAIYGGGTIIFGLYYNYLYAITHGFVKWVFFGELIASFYALLWPYYVYIGSTPF